jgi:hypothetical protein
MEPKPRRLPQNLPDSPPPSDEGTDVNPGKGRRTDEPRAVPPDSLPPEDPREG